MTKSSVEVDYSHLLQVLLIHQLVPCMTTDSTLCTFIFVYVSASLFCPIIVLTLSPLMPATPLSPLLP